VGNADLLLSRHLIHHVALLAEWVLPILRVWLIGVRKLGIPNLVPMTSKGGGS
jgi:hypothetical protein